MTDGHLSIPLFTKLQETSSLETSQMLRCGCNGAFFIDHYLGTSIPIKMPAIKEDFIIILNIFGFLHVISYLCMINKRVANNYMRHTLKPDYNFENDNDYHID